MAYLLDKSGKIKDVDCNECGALQSSGANPTRDGRIGATTSGIKHLCENCRAARAVSSESQRISFSGVQNIFGDQDMRKINQILSMVYEHGTAADRTDPDSMMARKVALFDFLREAIVVGLEKS